MKSPHAFPLCVDADLAGRLSPERSFLLPVQTCSGRLETAARRRTASRSVASTDWQSQIRGPCLTGHTDVAVEFFFAN